jgi:two-component system, response regulator PdtaR
MKSVYIVEDEVIISVFIKMFLGKKGFNVLGVSSRGSQAVDAISTLKPDVVIIDVALKGSINGIEVAHRIYEIYHPKIIFVTGLDEKALSSVTFEYSYLRKPFDNNHLIKLIQDL